MQTPPRKSPPHRFRGAQLAAVLCLALGCLDHQITQPAPSATGPLSPLKPAFSVTPIGSYTVTLPSNNTSGVSGLPSDWVSSGGVAPTNAVTIAPGTVFRVRVSGDVTVNPNPQYEHDFPNSGATFGTSGTYGPLGNPKGTQHELQVYLDLREGSNVRLIGLSSDTGGTAVSALQYTASGGAVWAGHAGVWGGTGNGTLYDGMYALSGDRKVTVEQIKDVVALTASSTYVRANTRVAFTAATADSTFPWHIGSWEWTPDAGSYPNPPCYAYTNPCAIGVGSSGTMTVHAWSGSAPFNPTVHVTVYSSFTLTANHSSVNFGDTVTFTPKFDGLPGPSDRWRWVPDSTSANDGTQCANSTPECRKQMTVSGIMWAYSGADSASARVTVGPVPTLQVTSSPSDVNEGDTVTFAGSLSVPNVNYQVVSWDWIPSNSGVLASRIGPPSPQLTKAGSTQLSVPKSPAFVMAGDSSQTVADSIWSDEGGIADPAPEVPTTRRCDPSTDLSCRTAVFQTGRMQLTVTVAGVTLVASAAASVHYECRPIYYQGLQLDSFPATSLVSGQIIDSATLDAPLFFSEYYGEKDGIPLGKYRPVSGKDSRGYSLVPGSYVVLTCRDWRTQRSDGSDWWRGSDVPRYAGHHALRFHFELP